MGHGEAFIIGFPMKKDFNFIAEAGYSQKGRRMRFNDGEWVNRSTYQFIDMTMLLRRTFPLRIEKNIPSQWYFNFGPEVSYWLSGDGEFNAGGDWYPYTMDFGRASGTYTEMAVPDPNRWLFGLAFGVGIKAPLHNNQSIGVELRFSSGHTFLSKDGRFRDESEGPDPRYPIPGGFDDTLKTNLKSVSLAISYTLDLDVQKSRQGKSTLDKKVKSKKPHHRLR